MRKGCRDAEVAQVHRRLRTPRVRAPRFGEAPEREQDERVVEARRGQVRTQLGSARDQWLRG